MEWEKDVYTHSIDTLENICAFWVAVEKGCTVETAFDYVENDRKRPYTIITPEDIEDMKKMKEQGLTQRAIGEIYGLHETSISSYIKKGVSNGKRGKKNASKRTSRKSF